VAFIVLTTVRLADSHSIRMRESLDGSSEVLTSYDNLTAVQIGTNHCATPIYRVA
jgi:hypothetical protein